VPELSAEKSLRSRFAVECSEGEKHPATATAMTKVRGAPRVDENNPLSLLSPPTPLSRLLATASGAAETRRRDAASRIRTRHDAGGGLLIAVCVHTHTFSCTRVKSTSDYDNSR